MLCLTRHAGESLLITCPDGTEVVVTVLAAGRHGGQVRLGVEAPLDVRVDRAEIAHAIDRRDRRERR